VTRAVPVPLDQLALVVAGGVGAVALVVAAGLIFLRSSTDLAEVRAT
jgi:hypothetical protein